MQLSEGEKIYYALQKEAKFLKEEVFAVRKQLDTVNAQSEEHRQMYKDT
jgi:hypothetical protein